jgi:hypothetical protein
MVTSFPIDLLDGPADFLCHFSSVRTRLWNGKPQKSLVE